jgi:serine/threonine protein kinase
MQDVDTDRMFKWKSAEKLEQPKITEVIVEEKLNAATIMEQAEPVVLPSVPSTSAVDTNSVSDVPIPAALPLEQPSVDLDSLAKAQKAEHDEMPPELGDRYEVIEFIGSGGMGSVWKVYDKQLQGTFAVKVLKPELLADATAVKRFEKEANLASDLTHANIAAIFGPGTDSQGRPFIIMGYVDGDSLADILACEGKLSEERALDIFTQICEALSHSHMKGIIHRDIKPSNIIISKTESGGDMVHIVDFGIARCIYDEVTKTQALTKAVDIFGSPRYMSPEQFLGNSVTGQSDIYSLGCVFYEMLTGAPPFTDENPVKLILQHISETPDLSKVPHKLQLLLFICLAKEPEQRILSVDRMLERIPSLCSNPYGAALHSKLLHGLQLVVLILLPGLTSIQHVSSSALPMPNNFIIMLFAWMYIASVNRDNAGRSVSYKILELNFCLAAIAAAILDGLAFIHVPLLELMVALVLASIGVWLMLQPKTLTTYTNSMMAIFGGLRSWQPRLLLSHEKSLRDLCLVMTNLELLILSVMASALVLVPYSCVVYGAGLTASALTSVLLPFVAAFVTGNLGFFGVRFLIDSFSSKRGIKESLLRSLKLQTAMNSFAVLVALVITFTIGRDGFNQLMRQEVGTLADTKPHIRVCLEAINYPDTVLAKHAKLKAANFLSFSSDHNLDALALCAQIIDSRNESDPSTLVAAHLLRSEIYRVLGKTVNAKTDLEKALQILDGMKKPSFFNVESHLLSYIGFDQVEQQALSVADLAVKDNNIELGVRALTLAAKHAERESAYLKTLRTDLQSRLLNLSRAKQSSSVHHN